MSNSVVTVTDSMLNDSLLLLVGEDGTVTPDKETVESYLSAQAGTTPIQLMHVNKSDSEGIDVAIENVIYAPDADDDYLIQEAEPPNQMDHILHSIKLDHDYTHLSEPVEEDELVKTLTLLESDEPPKVESKKPKPALKLPKKVKTKPKSKYEIDEDFKLDDFEAEEREQKRLRPPKVRSPPKPTRLEVAPPVAQPTSQEPKSPDKKNVTLVKKEKKVTKPIPDDFALFSTPDIIRRVGNKEACSEVEGSKPAKVERSRSASENNVTSSKPTRLSLDEVKPTKPVEVKVETKSSLDIKPNLVEMKQKRTSIDKKIEPISSFGLEPPDLAAFVDNKPFLDLNNANSMALDASGLDLDPSLLDNINNDLISDDILYQVAQSLVSNTELQNAIDKTLNEGNLVLPDDMQPNIQQTLEEPNNRQPMVIKTEEEIIKNSGMQIVRPDGRIVVIPPIERPTTRSRNKRQEVATLVPKHKPLDEEHVSGNELDSSGEEEESEDDPNKLWCVCNQPHNNRFMICCDTCEEWYHGKCVNITKVMGQQMEAAGKEWICLYCKDPHIQRPLAAARRIRKASRNSRQSSDSVASSTNTITSTTPKMKLKPESGGHVPCVVCQKKSRNSSIYCSEECILAHAQGVERVVVYERATGKMLKGSRAPSAANLEQWLRTHPGYEVVRSAGKLVTTKAPFDDPSSSSRLTQSKLKLIKNEDNDGVSLAVTKKGGVNHGVLKHSPKMGTPPFGKLKKLGPKMFHRQAKTIDAPAMPKRPAEPAKSAPPAAIKSPVAVATPLRAKVVQRSDSGGREASKGAKVAKARQGEGGGQVLTPPTPKQENIRENVQKTVFEQLTNRLKLAEDLVLGEDELKAISVDIESQLYKCFGDTGQKYRNKYRSLIFNIKDVKNQTLWRRICEKSINPYQLVRLSPDDMASQELALWREREAKHQLDMIKKSELELLNCNRQYVLKTHKGEEVLEDNRVKEPIEHTEVLTSLAEADKHEKRDKSVEKRSKHSHKERERKRSDAGKEEQRHGHHRSTSKEQRNRKRSRSKETQRKHGKRSRSRDKHRRSSHKSSRHRKEPHRGLSDEKLDKKSKEILEQLVDKNIVAPLEDRVWKEEVVPKAESDSDHEPTSTVTIPTPPRSEFDDEKDEKNVKPPLKEEKSPKPSPTVEKSPQPESKEIWRGTINMIDVAQISITAHEVSGDCHGLGKELPAHLDIVGRISPDTVWDYIGKMRCSNSKIISIVRLNALNLEEKMPYLALYSYLLTRNRLGVVKSTNRAVKDFYIWPQDAARDLPAALRPLAGPGFEPARPALLIGVIVRDRRKRHLPEAGGGGKRAKAEPARSYTPPPARRLPLPPACAPDDDEPYSPEDSDPEAPPPAFIEPFAAKFDAIPGLEAPILPSSTVEIQRQMEQLNQEIAAQKVEISCISQTIVTDSSEIGTSALASIALPSNLQQILDSIKTIGGAGDEVARGADDLTIPLLLPTSFSREADTIPLNLPGGRKKESVLSSLSEEDLIRKAEEMLGDEGAKVVDKQRVEVEQPPIPGLEDESFIG